MVRGKYFNCAIMQHNYCKKQYASQYSKICTRNIVYNKAFLQKTCYFKLRHNREKKLKCSWKSKNTSCRFGDVLVIKFCTKSRRAWAKPASASEQRRALGQKSGAASASLLGSQQRIPMLGAQQI